MTFCHPLTTYFEGAAVGMGLLLMALEINQRMWKCEVCDSLNCMPYTYCFHCKACSSCERNPCDGEEWCVEFHKHATG